MAGAGVAGVAAGAALLLLSAGAGVAGAIVDGVVLVEGVAALLSAGAGVPGVAGAVTAGVGELVFVAEGVDG